jgi:hypothetical protein
LTAPQSKAAELSQGLPGSRKGPVRQVVRAGSTSLAGIHQAPGPHMQIRFTKGTGKYDAMRITRANSVETIACPKQGIIPHDMVHFAVESTLQKRGFLSRVREGEPARFQMGAEPESDGVERLVEVLQADAWSGGNASPVEVLDLYQVTCVARECPALPIAANDIAAIRRHIRALDLRWQSLAAGQSIDLVI